MNARSLNSTDKTFGILLSISFIFWLLAKIPAIWDFVLFGVVYETGVFFMILAAVICTGYFLYQWIRNKFTLSKIYLYGFLFGVLTILMMRFVHSITASGITFFE